MWLRVKMVLQQRAASLLGRGITGQSLDEVECDSKRPRQI